MTTDIREQVIKLEARISLLESLLVSIIDKMESAAPTIGLHLPGVMAAGVDESSQE